MPRSQSYLSISILLIFFLVIAHSQPARLPGRNPPRQPPSNPGSNMHQNQNSRKPADAVPAVRSQQYQRGQNQEDHKLKGEQVQKYTTSGVKQQKRGQIQSRKIEAQSLSGHIYELEEKDIEHPQDRQYFQEQNHRKSDDKRQSLFKLLILIVAALITIVIILIAKIYFKRNKALALQSNSTQNRMKNNKPQGYIFQTYQENERITIKEKATKVEIIKDIFLKQPNQIGKTTINSQLPVSQGEQIKVGTPTFGQPAFHNQM